MSLTLSIPFERYIQALTDTLTMVGISASIAFLAGIPLAILLIVTAPGGFLASPRIHRSVGSVVNGFRATPFIVLLVALIPFTRLITGTTIGVWAAIVPLAISATPFFARIAEVSLREVDPGLIEAAQAMGCRKWHIIWHVYLPEALPAFTSSVADALRLAGKGRIAVGADADLLCLDEAGGVHHLIARGRVHWQGGARRLAGTFEHDARPA